MKSNRFSLTAVRRYESTSWGHELSMHWMIATLRALRVTGFFSLIVLLPLAGVSGPNTADTMEGNSPIECTDGMAGQFPCHNVDLLSHMPLSELGGGEAGGTDNWGWKDPLTGRYYAIMTRENLTAFVDVTDPANPVYLGKMPAGEVLTFRDAKTYANHVFVVADQGDYGMQVFDLTRLRGISQPQSFEPDQVYSEKDNAHNIAINEETGYAYLVSGDGEIGCDVGLHIVDISTPTAPVEVGCFVGGGRVHDTQCVIYHGPDQDYQGAEICFASANPAPSLSIIDVSDKDNIELISRLFYPQGAFAHQGWLTEDHRYFLLGDEADELQFPNLRTRTLILDVTDLDEPVYVGSHQGHARVIDHNLYVRGNHVYQANYPIGMRILRIDNLADARLTEVAWFDTFPNSDDIHAPGAWNVYPFFDNGILLVSDINTGLFVLRATGLPEVFRINAGLNDAWFNPETAGQGFFITVFENIQMIFLAWFTYDTERPAGGTEAHVGEPGHRWLTAFGPYADNRAVLDIEITEGGVFDAANPEPVQSADGTIILEFEGCNGGTVTFDIPSIDRQGVVPIERIALDNVPACEAGEAQPLQ